MLRPSSFRTAALLTTAAVVGLSAFNAIPASAQQTAAPYTASECDQIRSNILGLFKRYSGKISSELVADLKEFSNKNCDRAVRIRMVPGTRDNDAVGELKALIASRRASLPTSTPN